MAEKKELAVTEEKVAEIEMERLRSFENHNLGIAVAILVISYLLMGAWDIVAAFFASAKEFFTGVLFA